MTLGRVLPRLDHGDYIAEFYVNHKVTPTVYHYVVTKRGDNEILAIGQGATESGCIGEASQALIEASKHGHASRG